MSFGSWLRMAAAGNVLRDEETFSLNDVDCSTQTKLGGVSYAMKSPPRVLRTNTNSIALRISEATEDSRAQI